MDELDDEMDFDDQGSFVDMEGKNISCRSVANNH